MHRKHKKWQDAMKIHNLFKVLIKGIHTWGWIRRHRKPEFRYKKKYAAFSEFISNLISSCISLNTGIYIQLCLQLFSKTFLLLLVENKVYNSLLYLCSYIIKTSNKSGPPEPIPHTFNIASRYYGFFRKKYKSKRHPKLNSGKICWNPDEKVHKDVAR